MAAGAEAAANFMIRITLVGDVALNTYDVVRPGATADERAAGVGGLYVELIFFAAAASKGSVTAPTAIPNDKSQKPCMMSLQQLIKAVRPALSVEGDREAAGFRLQSVPGSPSVAHGPLPGHHFANHVVE
ncbi:MAG TPA: hypothetical protein PK867_18800 [Pirellulales bacterium]|nr:hypothetical protein [Pirellulales bacterium]